MKPSKLRRNARRKAQFAAMPRTPRAIMELVATRAAERSARLDALAVRESEIRELVKSRRKDRAVEKRERRKAQRRAAA